MAGCLLRTEPQTRLTHAKPRQASPASGIDRHGWLHPDYRAQRLRLGRPSEPRDAEIRLEFRDRSSAVAFVRRLRADVAEMAMLRSLLFVVTDTRSVHRLTDHEILERVADCLVDRRVVVVAKLVRSREAASSAQAPAPEVWAPPRRAAFTPSRNGGPSAPARVPEVRAPSGTAQRPVSQKRSEPPSEVDRLLALLEIAAHVATVRRAARAGHPLIEVCER